MPFYRHGIAFLGLLLIAWDIHPEVRHCIDGDVRVEYSEGVDYETACSGAGAAIEYMRGQGFGTDFAMTIGVGREELHRHSGRSAMGGYIAGSSRIVVLSQADCESLPDEVRIFGQRITPDLHRSFVVHEVAHAVAQYNSRIGHLSVATQEYIAYVVQFSTMAPALRAEILEHIPNEGFRDISEISSLFWALNPEVFAVKVYRHHQSLGGDNRMLKVLTQRALLRD